MHKIKKMRAKIEIVKLYGGRIVITNGETEIAPAVGFSTWVAARKAYNQLIKYL